MSARELVAPAEASRSVANLASRAVDASDCESVRRVALVVSELRPGGAERVVVHLAAELHRRGVEVLVICLQGAGELADELRSAGVPVAAIGSNRGYDVFGVWRLARVLRAFGPSVINVHDYSSLPYVAIASLGLRRCPVVFTAHGLLFNGFEPLRRRYGFFARRVSQVVAVSHEVGARHREYLGWKADIPVVANGVPAHDSPIGVRDRIREELGIPAGGFVFLAVGNPRPEKAFEVLVGAAESVRKRVARTDVFVLIAGKLVENEHCRQLRQLVEQSGHPTVRLLGYRVDVSDLYAAADAFVISSRSEGLPMVVLEAMMAGLPVVATRVGGIPNVVPRECGFLVTADREDELADAMLQLLSMTPVDREEMSRIAARSARGRFGVERMTDEYLKTYTVAVSVAR